MSHPLAEVKFRASGVGNLMTESRSKTDPLSETTKKYLVEVMIQKMYGRRKDIVNKYIQKGLMVEEDAITLYSRVMGEYFEKNETNLSNDFLTGTPDLFTGEDILKAEKIIDIKSSYDIFTFFNAQMNGVDKNYYWQLQAYMDLTGAKSAELAYCLVDTPESLIESAKRKFIWDAGIKGEDQYNHEAFDAIDRLAHYNDINIKDRVYIVPVARNQEDIDRLHVRVLECRIWLCEKFWKV